MAVHLVNAADSSIVSDGIKTAIEGQVKEMAQFQFYDSPEYLALRDYRYRQETLNASHVKEKKRGQ